MGIYDLFRERKQAKLLRLVTRKRQRYLNSEEYVKNICSRIIQNLNLMGNPIQEKMKKVPNAVIELMPIHSKKLREAVYIDDQKKQITPIYIYKIKNSPQKIRAITQELRIGRLHLNWFERNELIKGPFEEYRPLHLFSRCAKKEYYSKDLATSQYIQDNCMVNNLNGAMKYILGVKKQVKINIL